MKIKMNIVLIWNILYFFTVYHEHKFNMGLKRPKLAMSTVNKMKNLYRQTTVFILYHSMKT